MKDEVEGVDFSLILGCETGNNFADLKLKNPRGLKKRSFGKWMAVKWTISAINRIGLFKDP